MTFTRPPLSIRNNNPGNLEKDGTAWQGMLPEEKQTPEQRHEPYVVFIDAEHGFRALAIDLHTKWKRGLNTVNAIITVFAPPPENDTESYIKSVCDMIGAEPGARLDLSNPTTSRAFCRAISVHEAGGWFFNIKDLMEGVTQALAPE